MRRLRIDQQTEDWHEWRLGGIGGSDVAAIVGVSPWQTRAQLLAHKQQHHGKGFERKTTKAKNAAMIRGIELEPFVRDRYCMLTGHQVVPACVTHDVYEFMRASLDGLTDDNTLPIEIKVPSNVDHDAALAHVVPTKYYPQVQHQLLVTGCSRLHYVSYSNSFRYSEADQLVIVPILPSESYISFLFDEEKKFWLELMDLIRARDEAKQKGGIGDDGGVE